MTINARLCAVIGFLCCVGLMAAALYFQYVDELEPCPLCIFQRVSVMVIGAVMLAAAIHNPRALGQRIYGFLIVLGGASGIAVAGRHVWLQSLPEEQVPACGPGLEYMLDTFPFARVLELVFRGSGECADVQWTLFGLSMPTWSLIWFCAFTLYGLSQLILAFPKGKA